MSLKSMKKVIVKGEVMGVTNFNFNPHRDAERAIEMMKRNIRGDRIDDFSAYSACYVFSNENLSDYYPRFNMSNGKVLTVCGSGDQVLMAVLCGAKRVDCFDTNCLTYYNLMLKMNAVMFLDYSDFCSLYNLSNRVCDRKKIYKKFYDHLSPDVKYFWDYIFINGELSLGLEQFFPYFFKERDEELYKSAFRIAYLSEDNFIKLKELLKVSEVNFKKCNFLEVFNEYTDTYDFINLSNISTYIDRLDFVKKVREAVCSHLNDDGNIMINYSWKEANSIESINEIGVELGAEQREISSVLYQGKVNPSSIMVYGKKL